MTPEAQVVHWATGAGDLHRDHPGLRLLQLAGARRMLLLVDTRNLGKQAHQELVIPLADERPTWPRRRFRR